MALLRSGFAAGVAAYLIWGLFPLYWPLLEPAAALEILSHRIVWSVVLLAGVLAVTSGFRWLTTLGRRRLILLTAAAVMVTINWGTFIYGVNSGQVVETSLGYFINPLVMVALGVAVLGEKLRRNQVIAVGIAAVAVLVLAIDYGRPPWIALTLAASFALYGLLKKRVGMDGVRSLAVETALLLVPATAYLLWLGSTGEGTFTAEGSGHIALLVTGGLVTTIPLVLFGAAAIRIPLATLGILQYMTPSMQFLIGVAIYDEAMPLSRLAGFGLVWVALALFTFDGLRTARQDSRSARAEHDAAPAPSPTRQTTGGSHDAEPAVSPAVSPAAGACR